MNPAARDILKIPNSTPMWRTVLNWALVVLAVVLLVWLVGELTSPARSKPKSFAIVYPENGARNSLLALLGMVGVIFGTSYIGKMIGERAKDGRKVNYWEVLTDQLTHLFLWIVMLFTLYPIIYVISASLDPTNSLANATLGSSSEPLLVRARVLPSLEGKDFSNFAKLFEGVTIYPWQTAVFAVLLLGLLWLALLWVLTQQNGGIPTLSMKRQRGYANWVALGALAVLIFGLSAGQFAGFGIGSKFLLWVRNTLLISSITGVMAVVLTTTAGYAMARLTFPGRFQMLLFYIFIQMFPGFLGMVAIFTIIANLGLLNSFPGIILAYAGGAIAFGTWMYKGFVQSLPMSLEEAALVDGCTRWSAFTRIVLPLSGPMLVFIFLNQFIGSYAEFFLANILLSGTESWNLGVALKSLSPQGFDTRNFGVFSAAAVLGSLPIVAMFYAFQQVFVGGALSGGVKE
jgi:arabinogalactan oligomer / maltooligosaccharide transport system permease protein